jgi:hypothetical protein
VVVEKNSLVLYQQKLFHAEKIQLLPLADNMFYGTSEDKGDLYFTFLKDDKANITHFFARGGFGFTRIQFNRTD